jgi:hypothetical protein
MSAGDNFDFACKVALYLFLLKLDIGAQPVAQLKYNL